MKNVTRDEFVSWIGSHPKIEGVPVEGRAISAMQYIEDGRLLAAAVYYRGGHVDYRIAE